MLLSTFISQSPSATLALGKKIGERLGHGSILALMGELGCGKTLLTRGICAGLGVPEGVVNSPTFVLVNEYAGRLPIFHMDLYRLAAATDGLELGIMDYLARAEHGVMIIEWAEKILALLPDDVLKITFTVVSARKREIEFFSAGDNYNDLLKGLLKP